MPWCPSRAPVGCVRVPEAGRALIKSPPRRVDSKSVADSNLLRMDDVLLRAAACAVPVAGFGGLLWFATLFGGSEPVWPGFWVGAVLPVALAAAPIALLGAGLRLRRREKRAVALLRTVERQLVVRVPDWLASSGMSRSEVEVALRDLSNAGTALLVFDREADEIQDGRLRRAVVQVEKCTTCGARIEQEVELSRLGHETSCDHCGSALSDDEIDAARDRLVTEIRAQNASAARARRTSPDFSLGLFAILMIVCWPIALVYAYQRWGANADA